MAVVAVTETSSEVYADRAHFGEAGVATMRRLRLEHAVDPEVERNRSIVDLDLAERDGDGLVRFDHDVVIVQPADPAARNGWVLVDVANRGGPTASAFLQMDNTPFFPQPPQPPPGDGHLLGLGWTLAFTGWQFDIDGASLLGLRAPVARREGEYLSGGVSYVLRASSASERLPLVSPGHRVWRPIGAALCCSKMTSSKRLVRGVSAMTALRWSGRAGSRRAVGIAACIGPRVRWSEAAVCSPCATWRPGCAITSRSQGRCCSALRSRAG